MDRKYDCAVCAQGFGSEDELKRHWASEINDPKHSEYQKELNQDLK
jgi:hypothetical protein